MSTLISNQDWKLSPFTFFQYLSELISGLKIVTFCLLSFDIWVAFGSWGLTRQRHCCADRIGNQVNLSETKAVLPKYVVIKFSWCIILMIFFGYFKQIWEKFHFADGWVGGSSLVHSTKPFFTIPSQIKPAIVVDHLWWLLMWFKQIIGQEGESNWHNLGVYCTKDSIQLCYLMHIATEFLIKEVWR